MKLLLGFLISPFGPLPSSNLVQEVAHGRSAQVLDLQVNQMGRLVTIKKPPVTFLPGSRVAIIFVYQENPTFTRSSEVPL